MKPVDHDELLVTLAGPWGRTDVAAARAPTMLKGRDAYDSVDDLRASIAWAYQHIRERAAAGGKGWRDWPAPADRAPWWRRIMVALGWRSKAPPPSILAVSTTQARIFGSAKRRVAIKAKKHRIFGRRAPR
jgi:hypothetical protein